ncbi:ScyD/ScyE family protein [Angustibacter sp. McL0619]|uniref:ScyD/ScyE family protein n=1 Tax=Angustibacter sp. McL0619 TaxID=3415676 RepID=UPI003CEE9E7E
MARRTLLIGTTVAASAALFVFTPGAASAAPHQPSVTVLTNDVSAPFQLDYRGGLYVADGGTGAVSKLDGGALSPVAHAPDGFETSGVAVGPDGGIAYTTANEDHSSTSLTIERNGRTTIADLSRFEAKKNPDQHVTYGVDHPSRCVKRAFAPLGGATMKGAVDSHPYAVDSLGHGDWAVADAGGNDVVRVDGGTGKVSLIAVLPRQPLKVTAQQAADLGLTKCVVGVTYNFEAVPTDVELGPDGLLYVTTLPGGPEGPVLGARGSVYTVNPSTGRVHRLATGFLGATNLTVDSHGKVYVAELFAGQISTISHGVAKPYVALRNALAVQMGGGKLYASTIAPTDEMGNPTGEPGSIVRIGS